MVRPELIMTTFAASCASSPVSSLAWSRRYRCSSGNAATSSLNFASVYFLSSRLLAIFLAFAQSVSLPSIAEHKDELGGVAFELLENLWCRSDKACAETAGSGTRLMNLANSAGPPTLKVGLRFGNGR